MELHRAKSDKIDYLASLNDIHILLISTLAAIHANAEMFGGFNSESFKIKYNNLTRFGKKILEKRPIK
jgi:hypothetical protein